MSENTDLNAAKEGYINSINEKKNSIAKDEIEFVKNVADVNIIDITKGDGKEIIGLDEDKQKFFVNAETAHKSKESNVGYQCKIACYRHVDGTEILLQSYDDDFDNLEYSALLIKEQDYISIRKTGNLNDNYDDITVSIGKFGHDSDAKLHFRGVSFDDAIKPTFPDLYNVLNKYVPENIEVDIMLSDLYQRFNNIKDDRPKEDGKAMDILLFKKSLDKWNSGK